MILVQVLLEFGADIHSVSVHDETLLTSAVYSRNSQTVHCLVKSGYDINWRSGDSLSTGTLCDCFDLGSGWEPNNALSELNQATWRLFDLHIVSSLT